MNELDPELDARLALLREAAEPTRADKERLLVGLRTAIHTKAGLASDPVLLAGGADVARDGQRRVSAARPLVSWRSGVVVGASVAVAIGFGWNRVPGVPDPEPIASGGTVATAHHDTNTRIARPSAPPASPAPLGLAEALEQLHRAERAVYAREAEQALAILLDLDRRAGPALLREERSTTRVLALCQAGRVEEALDSRRQFEQEFAGSIYVKRLDESCAVERERR